MGVVAEPDAQEDAIWLAQVDLRHVTDRLKPSDFQNAKVSLKDAITLAEKKAGGGKAYEAEVEREGNAVEYEISVALADRSQEIKVGPDGTVKND